VLLVYSSSSSCLAPLSAPRSLDLDPNQPEVRRHRGALSGAKQELEDRVTKSTKDLLATPVSPDEMSWGAAYVTDRTAIQLYENGQSTRFQEMAIRLQNTKLKDGVRIQRIAYSPSREIVEILSAERIRPTGEIIKATSTSDDGERGKVAGMYVDRRFKTIAFDDIEQGDIVHIRYRTDSVGSNMFAASSATWMICKAPCRSATCSTR